MRTLAQILLNTLGARRCMLFVRELADEMNQRAAHVQLYLETKDYRGEGYAKTLRRQYRTSVIRNHAEAILSDEINQEALELERSSLIAQNVLDDKVVEPQKKTQQRRAEASNKRF